MATERTRADLVVRALDKLGVTAAGQNPAAEDYALIDDQVDSVLDSLAAQEIYAADPDAIALDAYQSLAEVLAEACRPDFGQPPSPDTTEMARRVLKRISSAKPTREVMVSEYV